MGTIDARLQRQMHLRRVNPDAPMEIPAEGDRPKVLVRFSGDVADLERAGMHVETVVGDIAVGHVDIADVQELSQIAHVSAVEAAQPTRPLIHDSVPAIHADVVRTGPLALTGTGVVVGVVDTGIDIFHHAFRNTDGTTRILSLWDQTLTAQAGEAPPAGFTFGVEFTAATINAALTSGASSFRSTDTDGHGSHVAGIAAGNGSASGNCHGTGYYIGVAPAADLVILESGAAAARELAAATRFPVPALVALGEPGPGYPLPWSVQTWLPGRTGDQDDPSGEVTFASDLAEFIVAVRAIGTRGRTFTGRGRGGDLKDHDDWMHTCLRESEGLLDVRRLTRMWAALRELPREAPDVMSHGDLTPGNVLVADGRLAGVLDVGSYRAADPALDLISAWNLLEAGPRQVLRTALRCTDLEWERSKAWAFEQAMGLVWYYADSNPVMSRLGRTTLDRIMAEAEVLPAPLRAGVRSVSRCRSSSAASRPGCPGTEDGDLVGQP